MQSSFEFASIMDLSDAHRIPCPACPVLSSQGTRIDGTPTAQKSHGESTFNIARVLHAAKPGVAGINGCGSSPTMKLGCQAWQCPQWPRLNTYLVSTTADELLSSLIQNMYNYYQTCMEI